MNEQQEIVSNLFNLHPTLEMVSRQAVFLTVMSTGLYSQEEPKSARSIELYN